MPDNLKIRQPEKPKTD